MYLERTERQVMPGNINPRHLWRLALLIPVFLAACTDTGGDAHYGRCASLFAYGRAPVAPTAEVIPLCEENETSVFFASGYSRQVHHGAWSAYRLDEGQAREVLERPLPRPRMAFRRNPKLDGGGYLQPRHDSYTGTGWDRGHLAPNGALAWSAEAQRASFTVSNIAPQDPRMNRNIWRCFETSIREWAAAGTGNTFVVVGTLGDTRMISGELDTGHVPVGVPGHFFAMVYRTGPQPMALGVMVPNEPGHRDIRRYVMSVSELERRTGYRFGMPVEVAIRTPDMVRWPTRVVAREYLGRLPPIDRQCPPVS